MPRSLVTYIGDSQETIVLVFCGLSFLSALLFLISIQQKYCLYCGLNVRKTVLSEGHLERVLYVYLISVHLLGLGPRSLLTNVEQQAAFPPDLCLTAFVQFYHTQQRVFVT